MKKYDAWLTRQWLRNALRYARKRQALRTTLLEWIERGEDELALAEASFLVAAVARRKVSFARTEEQTVDELAGELDRSLAGKPRKTAEARATSLAAARFSLGPTGASLLELARLTAGWRHGVGPAGELATTVSQCLGDAAAVSVLLGIPDSEATKTLRNLTKVGILSDQAASWPHELPSVEEWFCRIYSPPVTSEQELRERLVPLAPEPLLTLEDFDHLEERDDAVRLLGAAVAAGKGACLLFHGLAGTGKTEFAKALARAAGGGLYVLGGREVAGSSAWHEEATHREANRSAINRNSLRMAQALLRSDPGAVILCDEIEDVLRPSPGSRHEAHRTLEETPVPLLFTGNSLNGFDEAMLRRFHLTVRFKVPSPTRRRTVVHRMLTNGELAVLSEHELEPLAARLADELECPPGIVERAIHSTELLKGSAADLFRFAERQERSLSTHIKRPRLGPPAKADFRWADFDHLGAQAEDIRSLLGAAVAARRRGGSEGRAVSFLAYGPPGTGKTEFCRTLAAEAGATLYSVGQLERGPEARLAVPRPASLEYAIEALHDEPEAVLLFDEFEDFDVGSKDWFNGLVEANEVPLLFTVNAIGMFRNRMPWFLDRVTHSLEFRELPPEKRETMFTQILAADRPSDETSDMTRLADELASNRRITPRQVSIAARAATLSDGGADAARRAVEEKTLLRYGRRSAEAKAVDKYDFSLVHADRDLAALADKVANLGATRLGILLDGPSGSGKSEFAKQLAKRMNLDSLTKRASDLLSMWVGETEHQIAGAFAEARATRSLLILDEADSFLADRRRAQRNWEISQVNEVLSQLEAHDLPYVFTTNLGDRIDPASARRFLFRATFRPLDPSRIERAWKLFFAGHAPASVAKLTTLVPADFALVHERASKLGYLDDARQIADELALQCRDKDRKSALGFGQQAAARPARETSHRSTQ